MKVLVFLPQFFQLSGAERLGVNLAEELNKRGIHADILTMYTEDLPGVSEMKETLLRKGVPAIHFLGMQVGAGIVSVVRASLRLRRLIQRERYDVVEVSLNGPATIACLGALGLRIPVVVGLHHLYNADVLNGRKAALWRLAVKINRSVRFYAISKSVAETVIQFANISPSRIRVVYNAITSDFFAADPQKDDVRQELGIPREGRIALYVGRLVYSKGIETLIHALGPILVEQDLYLVYVGAKFPPQGDFPGEEGLYERIEKKIVADGLQDHVRFLGVRDDVARLMASSTVLVHAAWLEGFGLALVEALATGLPVVSTTVGGIPEVLEGTDALMVAPRDPEAFRDATLRMLERTSVQAETAAQKGRKRAETFRTETRVQAMIGLFEDVLQKRF